MTDQPKKQDFVVLTPPPGGFSNKKFRGFTERQRAYRINRFKGMNQYNAARAAGYSHGTAIKHGARIERAGRVGMKDLMEQAGLTDKFLIEYAMKGLEATRLFGADCVEHADWTARQKFFRDILELEGKVQKPGNTINIDQSKHVTYVLSQRMKQARERVLNARNGNTASSQPS